jgi:hypothetical protein
LKIVHGPPETRGPPVEKHWSRPPTPFDQGFIFSYNILPYET